MGYKIEGESCPVCKAYLFPEDDVVFCPTCGAPHHRDCYAAIGHCGLQELHGTPEQYSPKKEAEEEPESGTKATAATCPRCGREKIEGALFCPYCGSDFAGGSAESGYGGFRPAPGVNVYTNLADPYGGLPRDGSVKIDGESLEDVKTFVFTNTQRYLPLFARQSKSKRSSWNWAAFLIPHGWLCFRKNYTAGVIATALMLLSTICTVPLTLDLNQLMASGGLVANNQQELFNLYLSLMPSVPLYSIVIAAAGSIINLATRIYFALMGDWHYRQHTLSAIRSIKADSETENKNEALLRKGATSLVGFLIAYCITQLAPQIISVFM